MPAFLFYLLSFTWGLPITLAGCLCAAAVRISGVRCDRVGHCFRFRLKRVWGGFSLGMFMFVGDTEPQRTAWHEHGHGIQNCFFGPFMPFAISIPSMTRYWIRRMRPNKRFRHEYDDIWFESQATRLGAKQKERLAKKYAGRKPDSKPDL